MNRKYLEILKKIVKIWFCNSPLDIDKKFVKTKMWEQFEPLDKIYVE